MPKVSPTVAEIEAMRSEVPAGPVVMVNLVKFKPNGGKAAYGQYIKATMPAAQRGGTAVSAITASGCDTSPPALAPTRHDCCGMGATLSVKNSSALPCCLDKLRALGREHLHQRRP